MLKRCVECGYSLRGLPARHACPECGLEYDEHSECWRRRPGFAVFAGMGGFLGGTAWIIRLPSQFPGYSPLFKFATVVALVISFGAFIWLGWHLRNIYREGYFVAVLPDGLRIRKRCEDPRGRQRYTCTQTGTEW